MGILLNNEYTLKNYPPIHSISDENELESSNKEQPTGRKIIMSPGGVSYINTNNDIENLLKNKYPYLANEYNITNITDKKEPLVSIKRENLNKPVIRLNTPKGGGINNKSVLTTITSDKYNNPVNTGIGNLYVKKVNNYLNKYLNGQIQVSNPLEAHKQYLFLTTPSNNISVRQAENNKILLDKEINESNNYGNYYDNDKNKLAYTLYYNPEISKEARNGYNEFKKKLGDKSTYSYYNYFMKNYLPDKIASMEESGNYPDEDTKKIVYNLLGKRQ